MPQIYITFGTGTIALLTKTEADDFGEKLIPVVEEGFGILGTDDTTFTGVRAMCDRNETDVQIEIRYYTAREDEHGWGRSFNLTEEEQRRIAEAIRDTFLAFLKANGLPDYSLSVWFKPYRDGIFREWPNPNKDA